jgi:hypothetical protein
MLILMLTGSALAVEYAAPAPVGTINSATPTFVWNKVAGANDYVVSIISSNRVSASYPVSVAVCAVATCSSQLALPEGTKPATYSWNVTARKDAKINLQTSPAYQFVFAAVNQTASPSMAITRPAPLVTTTAATAPRPSVPAVGFSPSKNETVMTPIEFKWQRSYAAGVLGYEIVISDPDGVKQNISASYNPSNGMGNRYECLQDVCSLNSTTLQTEPVFTKTDVRGNPVVYTWTVAVKTATGLGTASQPLSFIPVDAMGISPATTLNPTDPRSTTDFATVSAPAVFKWKQKPGLSSDFEVNIFVWDGMHDARSPYETFKINRIVSPTRQSTSYTLSKGQSFTCGTDGVCVFVTPIGTNITAARRYSWTVTQLHHTGRTTIKGAPSQPLVFAVSPK